MGSSPLITYQVFHLKSDEKFSGIGPSEFLTTTINNHVIQIIICCLGYSLPSN